MIVKPCSIGISGSDLSCNTRIKSYPDGAQNVLCCDRSIFRSSGWESSAPKNAHVAMRKTADTSGVGTERAMRRARAQVRDMALCTEFSFFVTLTLDSSKIDRYDMAAITRKMSDWCDNQVRRKGLSYILVPERHKDGAVHFHGFFNGALETVDSGTITMPTFKAPRRPRTAAQRAEWLAAGGNVVYNLPSWSLGYTTAIGLYGEYARAVSYVCKYIGKGGDKIGGRWYYSGGLLGHPVITLTDSSVRDLQMVTGAYTFSVKAAGLTFVMLQLKGGAFFGKTGTDTGGMLPVMPLVGALQRPQMLEMPCV